MEYSVADEWARLKMWLEENSPATLSSLLPPSEPQQLSGFALHPDLVELYSLINGAPPLKSGNSPSAFIPPSYSPYTIERVKSSYAHMLDTVEYETQNGRSHYTIGMIAHTKWVPFAATASGKELVLDHRKSESYGAVLEFDEAENRYVPAWESLGAMLAEINSAVRGHGTAGRYLPRIQGQGASLEWFHPRFP
ncbi:SMI1/KNR4 family protein [Streptomyces sp. LN699]|uniref:SMI1/KNR4 family protein n=1 Tax=Streptomyces sp. LN699 TaxID=3112981 RepID=UPI003716C282